MIKKIINALMAITMIVGLSIASAPQAEARRGSGIGLGIAAGIIGLGIIGAASSARAYPYRSYSAYDDDGACYRGRRECHWAGRRCFENNWGDTVCRGGRYVCERPLICE
ncbi:MAG TPA: hypothetical protein PLD46_02045 [Hyphomicrobium sp.]|nr:hypothetical protein [Hyphomicrobium sp.]